MSENQHISFSNHTETEFADTLRQRVANYFAENNISKFANKPMIIKTVFMILLYAIPYGISISGYITNPYIFLGLWAIMGFGMAGIGLSIMHDANHGAYSKQTKINTALGYLLNFIGGNAINWKIQHNHLHHIYTNISGKDQDISHHVILRFSPNEAYHKVHRFQYIYAWFLYALMTLSWVTKKEFAQLADFKKQGLTSKYGSYNALLTELVLWKIFYFAGILVIPILVLPFSPWLVITAFLIMQFIAGFLLSVIFQSAHVMPQNTFPSPDSKGVISDNWTVHQLRTTMNFSHTSVLFSWFIGGLNYQIEHHLFPTICHVHYRKLSIIVRYTAEEYGIPYNSERTFVGALYKHGQFLKSLGKQR